MIDVLTLAVDRREALEAEFARMEAFIRMAEALISQAAADELHGPAGAAEQPALPALVVTDAASDAAGGESGPDARPDAGASLALEPVQGAAQDEPLLVLRRVLQAAADGVPGASGSRLTRLRRG